LRLASREAPWFATLEKMGSSVEFVAREGARTVSGSVASLFQGPRRLIQNLSPEEFQKLLGRIPKVVQKNSKSCSEDSEIGEKW